MKTPRTDELVRLLGLEPHPEGGFFREIYRSVSEVRPRDTRPIRTALTTIYYLLAAGQVSRWHRVLSDEVWHLYEAGPLEILVAPPDLSTVAHRRLAPPGVGAGPVTVVAAGWWQAARPLGEYALAGCTVGPGFDFADFRFLREDPAAVERLTDLGADYTALA